MPFDPMTSPLDYVLCSGRRAIMSGIAYRMLVDAEHRLGPEGLAAAAPDHVIVVREVDGELELRSVPHVAAVLELLPHVPAGPEQGAVVRACEPNVTHVPIAAIDPGIGGVVVAWVPRWPWLATGGEA